MLRAVAFCAHAYVKFKSSGTVPMYVCMLHMYNNEFVPTCTYICTLYGLWYEHILIIYFTWYMITFHES